MNPSLRGKMQEEMSVDLEFWSAHDSPGVLLNASPGSVTLSWPAIPISDKLLVILEWLLGASGLLCSWNLAKVTQMQTKIAISVGENVISRAWGDGFSEGSVCHAGIRIWVQLPKTTQSGLRGVIPPLERGTGQCCWCVPGKWELLFKRKKAGTMVLRNEVWGILCLLRSSTHRGTHTHNQKNICNFTAWQLSYPGPRFCVASYCSQHLLQEVALRIWMKSINQRNGCTMCVTEIGTAQALLKVQSV